MLIFKPHRAISVIKEYLPDNPVIVEAGAFTGQETRRLANAWPNGTIHAFEPVPELFAQLQQQCADLPNVVCHQYALSNTNGTALLYLSEKPSKPGKISQGNSLRAPKGRLLYSTLEFNKTITVPTITISDWAAAHNICHIDMLFLDTQGHEQSIIEGSGALLSTVTVIFTEVGFVEAYTAQLPFEEFTQWLLQRNFHLEGKDFTTTTDWFFGNALYVRTGTLF